MHAFFVEIRIYIALISIVACGQMRAMDEPSHAKKIYEKFEELVSCVKQGQLLEEAFELAVTNYGSVDENMHDLSHELFMRLIERSYRLEDIFASVRKAMHIHEAKNSLSPLHLFRAFAQRGIAGPEIIAILQDMLNQNKYVKESLDVFRVIAEHGCFDQACLSAVNIAMRAPHDYHQQVAAVLKQLALRGKCLDDVCDLTHQMALKKCCAPLFLNLLKILIHTHNLAIVDGQIIAQVLLEKVNHQYDTLQAFQARVLLGALVDSNQKLIEKIKAHD